MVVVYFIDGNMVGLKDFLNKLKLMGVIMEVQVFFGVDLFQFVLVNGFFVVYGFFDFQVVFYNQVVKNFCLDVMFVFFDFL